MIRIGGKTVEGERRALREVLGLPPSSGSPSGSTTYKRWNTCPRASRLYALGVRKSGANTFALEFGDAFHLTLEKYYQLRQQGQPWHQAVANAWQTLLPLRDEPNYDEFRTTLERCLTSYFELAEKDCWQVVAIEEDLGYFSAEFDYTARLDLVVIDEADGGLWIVEHKSTKVITADMTQGYLLDLQTLGQIWLLKQCVDLSQYPEFKGVIVNITSKQTTPKHARVYVRATDAHLAAFERSVADRWKMEQFAASLGYPQMLGNCSGAAHYFKSCSYFDICHGRPDFSLSGIDKLTAEDLPYGFTVTAQDADSDDTE